MFNEGFLQPKSILELSDQRATHGAAAAGSRQAPLHAMSKADVILPEAPSLILSRKSTPE
jgi:hypothetical protein